jgi:2-iminobutanoate/2-iminopropanoate deaminase
MSAPVGPYTPVVRAGDLVFVSDQLGLTPAGLVDGTAAQLQTAISNLATLLDAHGLHLDQVVKTTVFLVDMDDYAVMNEVYCEGFGDHRPARSAVAVAALPLGARVEIEAVVHAPA